MPLPISLTLAATFALFNLWLAYRCVRVRLKGPGGVGDLGIPALRARMRAHANLTEYTPFVLILIALLEYAGRSPSTLEGLGIERPRFTMQFIGALGTWMVLLALALWAVWVALYHSMGRPG